MYEDRSIAWMMAGGNRAENAQQRRDHVHLRALRESERDAHTAAALRSAIEPIRVRAMAALGLGTASVSSTTLDCCTA